ncbi:hypothetical protein TRFO_29036 [Tritrichomonas foetus]|uniref:Uncharacterized protein n=1 Tax=Tritrichomonas foetus TaxID=1144522 RepID=A0A1J4JWL9_9EUKA|nr:hypothetical protein TRFO_29036 [Tritrichomonas foetus]|eukprot:OHT03545.1 hypothetical protein TRFO_29036 [Tritrichomonas foetus]
MNELLRQINYLQNLGEDIKHILFKIGNGSCNNPNALINPIINDFDNKYSEVPKYLPFEETISTEYQMKVLEETKNGYGVKKERALNRYSKEIEQTDQRFRSIIQNISDKNVYYSNKVRELTDSFNQSLKQIDIDFVDKRMDLKKKYDDKNHLVDEIVNGIQQDLDKKLSIEAGKVSQNYIEQIEQRNTKLKELQQAITDINTEKENRLKAANEKIEKVQNKHAAALDLLNHRHELDVDDLHAKQKDLQNEIFTAEGRINSLKRRAEFSNNNFNTRIVFTLNAIKMDHQLKMKECQCFIQDVNHKIENLNKMIDNVDKNVDENIKAKLSSWQKRIGDEIVRRGKKVVEIEGETRIDYEKIIEERRERLKQLNYEISDNQLKSVNEIARISDQARDKVVSISTKFNQEIDKLQSELDQIKAYVSKVNDEWDALRLSTHCIYDHKLVELRNMSVLQKSRHEKKINNFVKKNTPVPDSTDYMALLQEELDGIESEYRAEENKLETDKLTQMKLRYEEDRSRGLITTRKQNVEEVNQLKDTEKHLKDTLSELEKNEKNLRDRLKDEYEEFIRSQDRRIQSALVALSRDNDVFKSKFNNEIEDIRINIIHAKADIEKAIETLKETREIVSAEPTPEDKEDEVRALFNKEKIAMQEIHENLRTDISLLKEQRLELIAKEKREKSRFESIKNTLEAERERYIKEVERGKNEIEFKYRRMTEEQERILNKMHEMWENEVEEKKKYKDQLVAEMHRLKKNMDKKHVKTDDDFRQKATEIRAKNNTQFKEIEDKKAIRYKEEEEALQATIDKEKLEYSKAEKYKAQDNKISLRLDSERYQKEYEELTKDIKRLTDNIKDLQSQLIKRLQWVCPDCEKHEKEIKDIKKSILDIVQRMHDIEKEEGNRQFTLSHFGKTTRNLPRLRLPNETANVV